MSSQLQQLKKFTTVVADTGDIQSIQQYQPQDATTNPTLIYKAAQIPEYDSLIEEGLSYGRQHARSELEEVSLGLDKIFVNFGVEILKIIPGRVSTEIDARLSFDTQKSVEKARKIIKLYEQSGVPRERVLIKLASTWEGAKAAEILEKEGIHCNMTLLFSLAQAALCADVGATLISPFVGRILDWYKLKEGVEGYAPEKDPGVLSVKSIYHYYKHHDIKTEIMGASFRNKDEITALAGIDLLTISPQLLQELKESNAPVTEQLNPSMSAQEAEERLTLDEISFRWQLNENAMATEKLAEGIRNFSVDMIKLEHRVFETSPI